MFVFYSFADKDQCSSCFVNLLYFCCRVFIPIVQKSSLPAVLLFKTWQRVLRLHSTISIGVTLDLNRLLVLLWDPKSKSLIVNINIIMTRETTYSIQNPCFVGLAHASAFLCYPKGFEDSLCR